MNRHLFFNSNWKLLPGCGLDHLSKLKPFNKTYLWNIDIDNSISGQVKEETEKSIRQRTRVIRVDGKPSTINLKRRLDRSPTRRRRIVKPATEGTEIPYEVRPSQSTINTHTTTTKTYPNHIHEMNINWCKLRTNQFAFQRGSDYFTFNILINEL